MPIGNSATRVISGRIIDNSILRRTGTKSKCFGCILPAAIGKGVNIDIKLKSNKQGGSNDDDSKTDANTLSMASPKKKPIESVKQMVCSKATGIAAMLRPNKM